MGLLGLVYGLAKTRGGAGFACNTTGTPALSVSGNTVQQTQGGSTPIAGSSIAAKPFIPAKFDLPLSDNNSNNYELWSKALMLLLLNWGLWTIVNGTEVSLDPAVNAAAHKEWKIKDQEAQLMILLVLKPVTQKSIYNAKTLIVLGSSLYILLRWG